MKIMGINQIIAVVDVDVRVIPRNGKAEAR